MFFSCVKGKNTVVPEPLTEIIEKKEEKIPLLEEADDMSDIRIFSEKLKDTGKDSLMSNLQKGFTGSTNNPLAITMREEIDDQLKTFDDDLTKFQNGVMDYAAMRGRYG